MTSGSKCGECALKMSAKDKAIERTRIDYFKHLCHMVGGDKYTVLLLELHHKHFYWLNPNDENRATDGLSLRNAWWNIIKEQGLDLAKADDGEAYYVYDAIQGPCTVLEMMIGFADRLQVMMDPDEPYGWFWAMLGNLDLDEATDLVFDEKWSVRVSKRLSKALDRTYEFDGSGGFWPLRAPKKDQREVELWFQACEWIRENEYV